MKKIIKLKCPICNSNLNIANNKDEIIVCNFCQSSLFSYKNKKERELMPFAINIELINPKLLQGEEIEMEDVFDEYYEDEELD